MQTPIFGKNNTKLEQQIKTVEQQALKTMTKKIISILIPLLVSCSTLNQNAHSSLKEVCIDLLSVRVNIDMPVSIRFCKEKYEEGIIYIYIFHDGIVFLHEGGLMQFDIDSYIPLDSVHTRKSSTYWGKNHGKFWKKYICGNVRLYYYNVNKEVKKKYDDIVKSIKISKRF